MQNKIGKLGTAGVWVFLHFYSCEYNSDDTGRNFIFDIRLEGIADMSVHVSSRGCRTGECTDYARQNLFRFYDENGGDNWQFGQIGDRLTWKSSNKDCCQWAGVECEGDQGVTDLQVGHIRGPLSDAVFRLSNLTSLSLWNSTDMTVSLESFMKLRLLWVLMIPYSGARGSLITLSHLTQLQSIVMAKTHVSGDIAALSGLLHLTWVDFSDTDVTGNIDALAGLQTLNSVLLSNTSVYGDIRFLSQLLHLNILLLQSTGTHGNLEAVSNMSNLSALTLSNNTVGNLLSLSNLSMLQVVVISGSHVEGDLDALANLKNLSWVSLQRNRLTGTVPSFSACRELKGLALHGNDFTGSIPDGFLAEATGLQKLTLFGNRLSCGLPARLNFANDNVSIVLPGNLFCRPLPAWVQLDNANVHVTAANTVWYKLAKLTHGDFNMQSMLLFGIAVTFLGCQLGVRQLHRNLDLAHLEAQIGWTTMHKHLGSAFGRAGTAIALVLMAMYFYGANYLLCAELLPSFTLFALFKSPTSEFVAICCGFCFFAFCWGNVRSLWSATPIGNERQLILPEADTADEARTVATIAWRCPCRFFGALAEFIIWALGVVVLSLPTVVYAMGGSVPTTKQRALPLYLEPLSLAFSEGQGGVFATAPMSPVLWIISNYCVPWWSQRFERCGLNQVVKQMIARMLIVWLLPTITIFILSEDCMRGWTLFWEPCLGSIFDHPVRYGVEMYASHGVDVSFSPLTKDSVCSTSLRQNRCSRAAVRNLTAILVQKMALQAFISPVAMLLSDWASAGGSRRLLTRCGVSAPRCAWPCGAGAARSKEQRNRASVLSLMATTAEIAIVLGPVIPMLVPLCGLTMQTALISNLYLSSTVGGGLVPSVSLAWHSSCA